MDLTRSRNGIRIKREDCSKYYMDDGKNRVDLETAISDAGNHIVYKRFINKRVSDKEGNVVGYITDLTFNSNEGKQFVQEVALSKEKREGY
jgi:hypothetical protein